ncbi:MAG: DUF11 domain-containing protein [Ardenticatenia bacterium]|nr:DUF11 domain-containing protein [Ardenticatenia bacterium]
MSIITQTDPAAGRQSWLRRAPFRGALLLGLSLSLLTGAFAASAQRPARPNSPSGIDAGPINGSFEAALANWVTTGRVQVLQDTDIGSAPVSPVLPTDGGRMALLCNGPGNIDATELDNLDLDPGPNNDNDRSTLRQTFTLAPNEVPATLTFDWSFLTSEAPTPGNFDDFFRVNLSGPDGGMLLAGSAPTTGVSPFPDVTPIDGVVYDILAAGPTQGCHFEDGRSAFKQYLSIIDTPGTYILEFLVSDQGNADHLIDTGLLIDNVRLTPEIDLAVTKTANPNPALAGETLFYDITVNNYGSGVARDVVVTDVLPVDAVYVADTNVPPCVQAPAGTLTCQLGNMNGGTSKTFSIRTSLKADTRARGVLTLANSVHVEAATPDRDLTNNDFTLRTTVNDRADLKVTKLSIPDQSIQAGETFAYQIYVDNLGPSYARNVTIIDDILASGQFTLVSIAPDPARALDVCTTGTGVGTPMPGTGTPPPGTGTPTPRGQIRCTLGEALEPQGFSPGNGRWSVEVRVKALNAVDVQNLVRVISGDPDNLGGDGSTPDPDLANNMAMDFIAVTSAADLRITKKGVDNAGDGPFTLGDDLEVIAGGTVRYTIVVDNDGPSTAENVTMVDQLPWGLVDGSVDARFSINTPNSSGICTVGTPGDSGDPLVCQIGDLLAGSRAIITIIADVDPSFVIKQPETPFADFLANDAYVTAATFDPNTLHNRTNDSWIKVVGAADLRVEKTDAPDPVRAGTVLGYRIRVTNVVNRVGPAPLAMSAAEKPVIDDPLPAGLNFLSATVLGGKGICAYDAGGRLVRCNLNDMAPGEVTEIFIVTGVDPSVPNGTVLSNTASRSVLTVTADPVAANNSATATTNVIADSDVYIEKSVDPVKVGAGETVKYSIRVGNLGPSEAKDVVVYDVLPDEVQYEIDTNQPMCTRPNNLVGLRAPLTGALPAMGLATFVLNTTTNVLVYSVQTTDVTGITSVTAGGVNLFAGPPPVVSPTEPLVGTITVTPAQAAALQAGATVNVAAASGALTGALVLTLNRPLRCEIGTLTVPISARDVDDQPSRQRFDIYGKVLPTAPPGSIISNVAMVTSSTEAVNPAFPQAYLNGRNNVATAKNYIEGKADLKIVKFGRREGQVKAGDVLTYTLIVDNLGPGSAVSPAIKDVLQSSGRFDLIDITSDRRASCRALPAHSGGNPQLILPSPWPPAVPPPPPPPPGNILPPTGIANIFQRLEVDCVMVDNPATPPPANEGALNPLKADGPPNEGRWIVTMRVRAAETQDIRNVADVLSSPLPPLLESKDPYLLNNHAEVETEITAVADLAVTKTAVGEVTTLGCPPGTALTANQVTAGRRITYTVVVRNNGPSIAVNTVLTDRLPPGIVVTSATVTGASGGNCETGTPGAALDRLTCGLGNIGPTTQKTVTVVADVNRSLANGTILENDVFVTSDVYDPRNRDNYAANLTTVNTAADLSITKTDSPDPVIAGRPLQYTITVTNNGPSDAQDVVVSDTLPAQLAYVSASGATCRQDPILQQQITCQLGTLPAGRSAVIFIQTLVRPDGVPSGLPTTNISNTATVATSTFDPCAANNSATQVTTVNRSSDVFIMKTDSPDPVIAGTELRYAIMFGNNGPSTATTIAVTDQLPAGITGLRCEPLDPDDAVTCSGLNVAGGLVTLNQILTKGTPVWSSTTGNALNDLDPGETYGFILVGLVESGYVLNGRGDTAPGQPARSYYQATGWAHFANNIARINALGEPAPLLAGAPAARDGVAGTDQLVIPCGKDNEATRVNALADLAVTKTDIFGNPATDPGNYFLQCDPVQPGGMVSYLVTVTNKGPSDAAEVVLQDQLPQGMFLALDPAQITISFVNNTPPYAPLAAPLPGQVLEVRDTGLITILIGRGANNLGIGELGRLNAGQSVTVRIDAMVAKMAPCGATMTNLARVFTRQNNVLWPPVNNPAGAPAVNVGIINRTPTLDPIGDNNLVTEDTKIECPSMKVVKTVSYNGECPGLKNPPPPPPGTPVTFCIEITNTGTTFLDNIMVTDILTTSMGQQTFTANIRAGKDPKLPVAPGETVLHKITVPPMEGMCGRVTNEVRVKADAVNSGRTKYPCLTVEPVSDAVEFVVVCSGADYRIELPALDTDVCETWLQVQNVGRRPSVGLLVAWGEPGFCPPQAAGPLKVECTGLLKPGSAWTWVNSQLPPGIKSAIVYSINATDEVEDRRGNKLTFDKLVCGTIFDMIVGDHDEWLLFDTAFLTRGVYYVTEKNEAGQQLILDFSKHTGEPLVVSVNRKCPDPVDPNRSVNAAYIGIGTYLEGLMDPVFGDFSYYAPLVFASRAGLNSRIHVHNSGQRCSSIEIWLKEQENCLRPILGDILSVAPGESVIFDPNTVVGPDWMGSAWIRASQPLGIVVDTLGPNHFTSYVGFPSDNYNDNTDYAYSIGSQVNYAPLVFSEYQGWDAVLTVQNLSPVYQAKVKVYFLDKSGDVITTLVDWVCPRGAQSFYLSRIADLPGNWVGSARVETQDWWTPGTNPVDAPRIQSVVMLDKWADATRTDRTEAVAYNALTEQVSYDWQVGGKRGGTMSGSAVLAVPLVAKDNRGINSELAIANLVAKPGFTDFAIYFYDQNGLLDAVCEKLHDRQVEYIDFATWGYVPNRFLGSAVISATYWEHEVFDPQGGFVRNLVGLGGTVVERIGRTLTAPDLPGDESKAFEAVPIFDFFQPQRPKVCPGQPVYKAFTEDFSAASTTVATIPNAGPLPQTVSQTVTVSGKPADCLVIDVDLPVNITHGLFGDLDLRLAHGAVNATLFDNSSTSFCNGNANVIGTLDDDAVARITSCSNPMLNNERRKTESGAALDAFNQTVANGGWTLTVQDNAIGGPNQAGVASLNSWSVTGQCRYRRLVP